MTLLVGSPAKKLYLALGRRVVDPVVEAAALHRVVEVPGAVRGQDDHRRMSRPHRPDLGDRHRGVGEQLEQERLEVVVGAVDLVDQEHRGPRPGMLERAQQRSANQVVRPNRSSSESFVPLESASRMLSSWRG